MRNPKFYLTALFFALSALSGKAQDVIITKDSTEIEATITWVGEEEIRYVLYGTTEPIYRIPKSAIVMVKYDNSALVAHSFKHNSFGLDFDLALMHIWQHSADYGNRINASTGVYWLHKLNDKLSWKVLNARLSYYAPFQQGASYTQNAYYGLLGIELMTGIRYLYNGIKNFFDISVGWGNVWLNVGSGNLYSVFRGFAFDFGWGRYLTDKFYVEAMCNLNANLVHYGVKFGWNF